jgi:hypothetical protein
MCLILSATVPAAERAGLEEAARAVRGGSFEVEVERPARWPWTAKRAARATISDGSGCACSLLSDEATWEAETWSLRPEIRGALADFLRALAERVPLGTVVSAIWVGERARGNLPVTPAALAELVRQGRLGTHTSYTIQRDPAV